MRELLCGVHDRLRNKEVRAQGLTLPAWIGVGVKAPGARGGKAKISDNDLSESNRTRFAVEVPVKVGVIPWM